MAVKQNMQPENLVDGFINVMIDDVIRKVNVENNKCTISFYFTRF